MSATSDSSSSACLLLRIATRGESISVVTLISALPLLYLSSRAKFRIVDGSPCLLVIFMLPPWFHIDTYWIK